MNLDKVTYHKVEQGHVGQRLDNYLRVKLKGLPKSRLYRLLRKGEIRVNKKRVKPEYRLQKGDELRLPPINLSQPKVIKPDAGLFKGLMERIIYEDDYLLAINKPHGIAVHGGTQNPYGLIECLKLGLKNEKLELIHRIDKETSGCLLIAKSRQALKFYHQVFRERELEKHYYALVHGHWPRSLQKVDLALQRSQAQAGEQKVKVNESGQHAVTYYSPEHYYKGASLLKLKIITGRTHQIRVHSAYQQHPIVGDEKYGSKKLDTKLLKSEAKRMYLHAFSLSLPAYNSEQIIRITAPFDANWQQMLDMLAEN